MHAIDKHDKNKFYSCEFFLNRGPRKMIRAFLVPYHSLRWFLLVHPRILFPRWRLNLPTSPFAVIEKHNHCLTVIELNWCRWMVTEFNHHAIVLIKNLSIATCGWRVKKIQSPCPHGNRNFSHHAFMVIERFRVV
jgi:hypothetical protein